MRKQALSFMTVRRRLRCRPRANPGLEASDVFCSRGARYLAAVFYAAGQHEIGSFGADVCQYGSTFCDNSVYVLTGAGLTAVWGKFVSIR